MNTFVCLLSQNVYLYVYRTKSKLCQQSSNILVQPSGFCYIFINMFFHFLLISFLLNMNFYLYFIQYKHKNKFKILQPQYYILNILTFPFVPILWVFLGIAGHYTYSLKSLTFSQFFFSLLFPLKSL